jgi:integrase
MTERTGTKKSAQKRRDRGDGSIYVRADGRFVGSLRMPNGTRKDFYGKTKQEVKEKLKKAQTQLEQGTLVTAKQQSVASYLAYWLTIKRPNVRASTAVSYRGIINNHIVPHIGYIKLQKLTGDHIQALYSTLLEKGLSPTTVGMIHTVLVSSFKDAVKWKRIGVSPCESVTSPRHVRKDMKFLTVEQARHLLDAVKGHPLEAMIVLAVLTGARRGELFALHWDDINFRKGTIRIHRSLSYKNADGLGCIYREELPKTAAGIRTIPLPDIALEVLKAHKAKQLKQRLQCGEAWKNLNLVFCTGAGSYYNQSNHHTTFRKILEGAGLPFIRFHDLRHSAATILLSMGVNPKVIQERLGHANITITLGRYAHVTTSMQNEANGLLNQAFQRTAEG